MATHKQPSVVARRVVRGKDGRFTCAMPLRNPNGELILPREYWDRRSAGSKRA